ncbi:hypothetical protein Ahy_A04g020113 [Arachis hypogaea]|uniref:Uncharacterized protein n=1 Tax=Arachis hypogaea TaxID=3818 RepID=A0A445DH49_ARAHY|nr:hypothetical protein Ahy_A04g020113 [Arachis hypogaea]
MHFVLQSSTALDKELCTCDHFLSSQHEFVHAFTVVLIFVFRANFCKLFQFLKHNCNNRLLSIQFTCIAHLSHMMTRKGKEKANPLARSLPTPLSTLPDTFINAEAQEQYKKVENKPFHYEQKLNLLEKYADQDGYPTIFLRGVTLDTFDTTLEAILDILHIPPAHDAYTQTVKDLLSGKLSLDVILKKNGTPDARWEYSKGETAVPQSITCTGLNPEVRIWQQIIADYILLSTHATHIRVRVAVLLWAILEGKRISVLPLIRDSMWKVTQ